MVLLMLLFVELSHGEERQIEGTTRYCQNNVFISFIQIILLCLDPYGRQFEKKVNLYSFLPLGGIINQHILTIYSIGSQSQLEVKESVFSVKAISYILYFVAV